ncbi:MAG: hypothetical protein ACJ76H_01145 [Bacteriovoracaceae bacterium]
MRMPNYYETLNVSNTCSYAELQASYNVLKKMFGGDPQMNAELDKALSILGEPVSRSTYDRMLTEAMNKKAARSEVPVELPPLPEEIPALPMKVEVRAKVEVPKSIDLEKVINFDLNQRKSLKDMNSGLASKIVAIACSLAIIGAVFMGITTKQELLSRVGFLGLDEIFPKATSYSRPLTAPNGQVFPEASGYMAGYQQTNNEGASSLKVINSKNANDVYLKLVTFENGTPAIARHVFIRAGSDFVIDKLSEGKYEIQYQDLSVGQVGRSETFEVTETKTEKGVDATLLSVRLKTAVNGVLRVERVPESEFNSIASL